MTSTQTIVGISLAFLGGAAVGAAAVYASNPDNRKKMSNALESSRRMAKRVPDAIEDVKGIATDALHDARDTARNALNQAGNVAKEVLTIPTALRNGPHA